MTRPNAGFSRIDLLAVLVAIGMVILVAMPLVAASSAGGKRAGCYNNLRQVGIALNAWGGDHRDRIPSSTPIDEGGTRPATSKWPNVWPEFLVFSNHLSSPRMLACPEDIETKVADNWGKGTGGFQNPAFRPNALSYFIGYHASPVAPHYVVTGDRNFQPTAVSTGCSRSLVINCFSVYRLASPAVWTNAVHIDGGNLLFLDGTVDYVSSAKLTETLDPPLSDTSSFHYAPPR